MAQRHGKGVWNLWRHAAVASACWLIAACKSPPPASSAPTPLESHGVSKPQPAAPVTLTVLGDNDIHGALDAQLEVLTFADGQTARTRVGGAETIAAYYARARALDPGGVILVSAGDFFQGTLIANESQGASVIEYLDALHYDAVAIGNHEFDYGPLRPEPGKEPSTDDPRGALLRRMAEAHFPFLSCNIIDDRTGQSPDWPNFHCATLIERRGVKIGLIGATTTETPRTTIPGFVRGLSFLPVAEGLRRGVQRAKALGAEVVIALVHAGTDCSELGNPNDPGSCNLQAELPTALRELGSGALDAVVAGHTHGHIAHFLHGVPVIESSSRGTEFGRIELEFDPKTHRVLGERTRIARPQRLCTQVIAGTDRCDQQAASRSASSALLPASYLGTPIVPDIEVGAKLEGYRKRVQDLQARVVAQISSPIRRTRFGESPLGDLVTDCMREATRRDPSIPDADFAIQNSGGMRSDIEPGPLTFGKLYEVLPFDNVLVTASVTGSQVLRIFELALAANVKVYQVSGLIITYGVTRKSGSSTDLLDVGTHEYKVLRVVLANGNPLEPTRHYTLVWNDFLAQGGDGMAPLVQSLSPETQVFHQSASLRQAVEDSLGANPHLAETTLHTSGPRIRFEKVR
jgi:5'-nucleotidase